MIESAEAFMKKAMEKVDAALLKMKASEEYARELLPSIRVLLRITGEDGYDRRPRANGARGQCFYFDLVCLGRNGGWVPLGHGHVFWWCGPGEGSPFRSLCWNLNEPGKDGSLSDALWAKLHMDKLLPAQFRLTNPPKGKRLKACERDDKKSCDEANKAIKDMAKS